MSANYELWYADGTGKRLAYINDVSSFEYVKVLGDIGIGVFQFPVRPSPYKANVPDRRIHIYRQPVNGRLKLDFSCRLRKFDTETTRDGQFFRSLQAYDNNEVLRRRIVADYASDTETILDNEYVDDGMKRIWTEAFDDSQTGRDITDYGFSVAPNLSDGPQVNKQFSWRNVLEVLQDLQADSKSEGNEVFFGLIDHNETSAQFTTWINQPGRDLTGKITFSLERGNLSSPRLSYDYSDEANMIYAGGQGQNFSRIVRTAFDQASIDASVIGFSEKFRDSQGDTNDMVQADADAELAHSRVRITFSATIADTPMIRYGRDWNLGDRVSVDYGGLQFTTIIRSVRVRVDPNGKETVESRVENVG